MFENYVKINKEIKALALENKYYFYTLIWSKNKIDTLQSSKDREIKTIKVGIKN